MRRYELSAAQWRKTQGFLPGSPGSAGANSSGTRTFVVNGVLWVLRSGVRWRDLPSMYGDWKTVYRRFLRWENAGVWERVFRVLLKDPNNLYKPLDSDLVRAHRKAVRGEAQAGTRLWGVPWEF